MAQATAAAADAVDVSKLGWNPPPEVLDHKAPKPEFFLEEYAKPEWVAPWDIGRAQSALIKAEKEGLFKGQVLDVGCGQGDNAVYLASKGYHVTGVDLSQHALDRAAKRGTAAGVSRSNLVLKQVDMLILDNALGNATWDSVLDSALLHCFEPEQQRQYLANLAPHVKAGAKLVLFCMSDANPDPWVGPKRLKEHELCEHFQEKNGWRLEQLSPEKYDVNLPVKQMHAWRAVALRL